MYFLPNEYPMKAGMIKGMININKPVPKEISKVNTMINIKAISKEGKIVPNPIILNNKKKKIRNIPPIKIGKENIIVRSYFGPKIIPIINPEKNHGIKDKTKINKLVKRYM